MQLGSKRLQNANTRHEHVQHDHLPESAAAALAATTSHAAAATPAVPAATASAASVSTKQAQAARSAKRHARPEEQAGNRSNPAHGRNRSAEQAQAVQVSSSSQLLVPFAASTTEHAG